MQYLRRFWLKLSSHRLFLPAVVFVLALALGLLLSFPYTRNLIRVRGPYLAMLSAIAIFPVFTFRFFEPHDDPVPISWYFVLAAVYYINVGSPELVGYLRNVFFGHVPMAAFFSLLLGFVAVAAIAGALHFAFAIYRDKDSPQGTFLAISPVKFGIYALLQVLYLNLFVALVRDKFGISGIFSSD